MTTSTAGDSDLQPQIAALRELVISHRNHAREMWDACAPDAGSESKEARLALGRYTEKLLKGKMDETYR